MSRRPEQHAATRLVPARALRLTACLLAGSGWMGAAWAQSPAKPAPPPTSPPAPQTPDAAQALPDASPGVAPDQDADGLLSADGLPSTQNTTLLDGVSLTQGFSAVAAGAGRDPAPDPEDDSDAAEESTGPAHGLARGRHSGVASVFSQAATREFRVATQDYSAQSAHTGGAVVSTLSRSGVEGLHGSGFFTLRASAFAAAEPYAIATTYNAGVVASSRVKPHDLREAFGGTLGGPLAPARTRLFGFYTVDAQRRGFPAISSPADPNFYSLTAGQRALLGNRGVSAAAIDRALGYLSSLTGATDRRADRTLNFGRLDWLRHPHYGLALEYNRVRWSSPAGLIEAPVVARGRASLGNAAGSLDAVLLRVETAFGPRTSNQARVNYLRDLQYETPQAPLPQEPAVSPGGFAPEVNIGPNGLLFGTPASLSQGAFPDERRLGIGDVFTLTRGRHTLILGGEVAFVHDRVAALTNAEGTFRYDSTRAGGGQSGIADFITDYTFNVGTVPNGGCPSIFSPAHLFCFRSYTQSFGGSRLAFSTQDYNGFGEDIWRVRPGLTVTAGLRFDYTLLPIPITPNAALDAVFGAQAATGIFPEDRNNVGPRLAVAWEPLGRGRGVFRAGYGLFYGRLPGATIRAALADTALPASTTRVRITPAVEATCTPGGTQGFGYPCAFPARPAGAVLQTGSAVVFDRHFRLPLVQQGSFAFERSLGRTTLTAAYVLNLDRQLPGSTDLNIAPSDGSATYRLAGGTGAPGVEDGESFTLPRYTARVSPAFGPVTELVSHANGSYNGLALTVLSRPAPGLTLRGEYTWSKAIDDAPDLSATPRTDSQLDPFANGYDKGLSALNYPWRARAAADWRPRLRSGSRFLRGAANGWSLAPIVAARAGRPYSFDLSGGPSLSGGHESLNGSGGALYLPTVGRNTLRLPATVNVDLRLARSVGLGSGLGSRLGSALSSRTRLQVSAEAFNLFNHRNVSSVTQRAYLVGTPVAGVTPLVFQSASAIALEGLNTQPFAAPTAASTASVRARQVQLQLRLQF